MTTVSFLLKTLTFPHEKEAGEWVNESTTKANGRGHWGPLEHPAITF